MQTAKGLGDSATTIGRQGAEFPGGGAHLLALLRGETFHSFRALENGLTLLWAHTVKLGKPVAHSLLLVRLKLIKAGLVFQRALLLVGRKTAMRVHPRAKMLLSLTGVIGIDERVVLTTRTLYLLDELTLARVRIGTLRGGLLGRLVWRSCGVIATLTGILCRTLAGVSSTHLARELPRILTLNRSTRLT